MYNYSTIPLFAAGNYQAFTTVGKAKQHVNFALGAAAGLGELIAVDGQFYLAEPKGKLSLMADKKGLSSAVGADFKADSRFYVRTMALTQLEKELLKKNPSGRFMAIKVTGLFKKITARSEDFAKPPYQPFSTWMKTHQHVFSLHNVTGTLVMFYLTPSIIGVGVPGFHAHFISLPAEMGGHVFSATIAHAKVEVDTLDKLQLYTVNKQTS